MTGLPTVSSRQAIAAFGKAGFIALPKKRGKGSHTVMKKAGHRYRLTIPKAKDLAEGTLRGLIRSSGLTVEQFVDYLGCSAPADPDVQRDRRGVAERERPPAFRKLGAFYACTRRVSRSGAA